MKRTTLISYSIVSRTLYPTWRNRGPIDVVCVDIAGRYQTLGNPLFHGLPLLGPALYSLHTKQPWYHTINSKYHHWRWMRFYLWNISLPFAASAVNQPQMTRGCPFGCRCSSQHHTLLSCCKIYHLAYSPDKFLLLSHLSYRLFVFLIVRRCECMPVYMSDFKRGMSL